jgi:uncharacterized repeat protein (TIGR01451 family)
MNGTWFQHLSQRGFWARLILGWVLLFGALPTVAPVPVDAQTSNPAPVQMFYVTLPEADALTVFDAVNSDAGSPIVTYFSIAVGANGTYVYYDQWENGYDSDIANPTDLYSAGNPDGVQIWGNSKAEDGCAPNKNGAAITCTNANDVLNAGDVVIPSSNVPVPRGSAILFDARDKVGASKSIAMARAAWPGNSGGPYTLNAFGHEMYSTAEWGVAYESPVGANTPDDGDMFEYASLSIMAAQNNTTVQIDANGDGTYETTVTLNEGGSYLATGISRGARVQVQNLDEAKPIQVVLLTGDIGSSYESRDMNLLPTSAYGSSYWSPVGVDTDSSGPTRLFLYNPSSNGTIYISCERRSAATITYGPIAPRGVVTHDLSDYQAEHCYASTSTGTATADKIFAIGTVDTDGQNWDWSFTLFPDSFLSTDALVGLGLGRDPTYDGTANNENGSPLWVTPACASGSTYIYVDWNNDGTPDRVDLNGDGDTGDTVDGISENSSNNGMQVTRLRSVRLFEPGLDDEFFDQSGARVWSRTASGVGYGGTPGCKLALAWGEDPSSITQGRPGLDVGTSCPPLRLVEGTKSLALKTDADGDGLLSPGDTATYNITIKNTGAVEEDNIRVYDTVPANTTYNPNSTQKNVGAGWASIPDDGSGTAFPLDVTGGVLLGDLGVGATFYVRFDVALNNIPPGGPVYEELLNCDTVYYSGGTIESCVTSLVASNDWGDLPDSYGTSLAQNGPRHSPSGLKLGSHFDRELQGQPTVPANGDDTAHTTPPPGDDEDGIVLSGTQTAWSKGTGTFQVTVTGSSGCLNAWMDFTNNTGSGVGTAFADGDFVKTGGYDTYSTYSEHIIQNLTVSPGTSTVTVAVPPGLIPLPNIAYAYYFRFRLSPSCGSIAPTGFVTGGEVEDYRFDLTVLPTVAVISRFETFVQGGQVIVEWETAAESNSAGFFLYRQDLSNGQTERVNDQIVPAFLGTTAGGTYRLLDPAAQPGGTYAYSVQEIEAGGPSQLYGPFVVTADQQASAASSLSRQAGVMYERQVRTPSLEAQQPPPEPNTGTDVPADLPESEEEAGRETFNAWLPLVSQAAGHAAPAQEDDSGVSVEATAAVGLAKLTARRSGLYYLAGSDMAPALGLSPSTVTNLIKNTGLKLTNQGQMVAWLAASGNTGIYFYGEGLDSPYTWDNVYWLQKATGQKFSTQSLAAPAAVPLGTFPTSSHAEQNVWAATGLISDPAADYWMWEYVVAGDPNLGRRSFALETDGAAAQGPASLTARFLGLTASGTGADHHARLLLNGTAIGETAWSGAAAHEVSLPIDPALLKDGANTLEVVGLLDAGVPYSVFYVNSFDVSYQRAYQALNDMLAFTSVNNQAVTVYGFSSSNVMVFDLSNPKRPKRITTLKVQASNGAYRVTFKPAVAGVPHLATATAVVPRITTLAADAPSALKGTNGANYLILTTAGLAPPAQALAAYRQGQGLRSQVVDVQDVYDEFNGGVANPQAIRTFLAHAYANWNPPPRYVLLAGAGSYDYKNYTGYGDCLVPPILEGATGILSPADSRYADLAGDDGAPEIALGRLPVLTPDEFEAYTAKVQAYEATDPAGWSRQVLLLADNDDPEAGNFASDSDLLAAGLPAAYSAQKVYLGPLTKAEARSQALAALGAGVGVFNFIGHAGLNTLAAEGLLLSSDVPGLHNSPRLAFLSAATCAVGNYGNPGYRSLGVLLTLQGDGGAGAVFAPTGLGFNQHSVALDQALFQHLFAGDASRAGDATRAALVQFAASGGPRYALDIYTLLGDPALRMVWR